MPLGLPQTDAFGGVGDPPGAPAHSGRVPPVAERPDTRVSQVVWHPGRTRIYGVPLHDGRLGPNRIALRFCGWSIPHRESRVTTGRVLYVAESDVLASGYVPGFIESGEQVQWFAVGSDASLAEHRQTAVTARALVTGTRHIPRPSPRPKTASPTVTVPVLSRFARLRGNVLTCDSGSERHLSWERVAEFKYFLSGDLRAYRMRYGLHPRDLGPRLRSAFGDLVGLCTVSLAGHYDAVFVDQGLGGLCVHTYEVWKRLRKTKRILLISQSEPFFEEPPHEDPDLITLEGLKRQGQALGHFSFIHLVRCILQLVSYKFLLITHRSQALYLFDLIRHRPTVIQCDGFYDSQFEMANVRGRRCREEQDAEILEEVYWALSRPASSGDAGPLRSEAPRASSREVRELGSRVMAKRFSREEMRVNYHQSAVNCRVGRDECSPLSVFESMACGLPVIVSPLVACQIPVIEDGKTGFVVDPDDLDMLVDRLRRIVGNSDTRDEMGRECQRRATAFTGDARLGEFHRYF